MLYYVSCVPITFIKEHFAVIPINNISEVWLELTMIPFLFVLSVFLGGRMATTYEINKRFLMLVVSTLAAATLEAILELFTDLSVQNIYMKIFYALININAYCLMAYVAAYTRCLTQRFIGSNFFLLCIAMILLFMFRSDSMIMLFSPGFAILFVVEGFILQIIHQEYYSNGQFIVMNLLFIMLIDSFLMQYLFRQNVPLVYTIATMMLVFTFFYLEAPTYRQLIIAHREIDQARIRAETSIRQATVANKAKSNFLASTSHEIRTPMNAILGINDMILAEKPEPESARAALAIKGAGEYLLALVNNILDISKIEAGKMELYETDYHLWELLKDCEADMTERLRGKDSVKFIVNADKDTPEHLHGDALRLKQALSNFLSNAAKYTKNGSVTLNVSGEKKSGSEILMKFVIEDTGIGMHDDELGKIYDPFERANIIETRHIPGAGLGLTLVKNIIDIMNGRISVTSEYGKGTRFTVEIPQRLANGEYMTLQKYEEFMSRQPVKTEVQEDDNDANVWPDAKILVVDDTPVNLVVAKGMLKNTEAEIDTSESGEEALDMMKKSHYDLVFLDHKMPGMDGVETLKQAKEHYPDTKYIALTANAGANARNEYITLGFDDYLPKPFKGEEMTKILKTYLKKN